MAPSNRNVRAANALLLHNLILLQALVFIRSGNRRRRSMYVRSILQKRAEQGEYRNLIREMQLADPEYHWQYFRMSASDMESLLRRVGPHLTHKPNHRWPIGPAERLSLTIRYLATGNSQVSVSWGYRVGRKTVCDIIKETCDAIWTVLQNEVLKPPNTQLEWRQIANGFEQQWNFPHCIGAIDGKHLIIRAPKNSGSLFYNYKHTFSIVLMAVCDAYYCFTLVDLGRPGRHSDGGTFANSAFGKELEGNNMNVPMPQAVHGFQDPIPYVLVGDEAFPLKSYLMRPYPRRDLQLMLHKIYNYRLSRARRVIENSFGILACRWQIFLKPIYADPVKVISITKAALCLHNLLQRKNNQVAPGQRRYCAPDLVDQEQHDGGLIPGRWRDIDRNMGGLAPLARVGANMFARDVFEVRNAFAQYFVSAGGELAWQYAYGNRTA